MTGDASITLGGWALVLGASSGFGAAAALAFARAGVDVFGVHLDRKSTLANVERITADIRAYGRQARFFNVNAADPERRAETAAEMQRVLEERGETGTLRILLHSLAFGTLKPFVAVPVKDGVTQAQMDMTVDVMAHSLVYWTQELVGRSLMTRGGRRTSRQSRARVPPTPPRLRARSPGHHGQRDPRRGDGHARRAEDSRLRSPRRHCDPA